MSTKTNFKRIALVAVAALGMGVLSSVPSQAATSGITVTVADGTTSTTKSDSTTAATFSVSGVLGNGDSITATLVRVAVPTGTVPKTYWHYIDSSTPTMATAFIETRAAATAAPAALADNSNRISPLDTSIAVAANGDTSNMLTFTKTTAQGYVKWNMGVQLDTAAARVAGTYTYQLVVRVFDTNQLALGSGGLAANQNPNLVIERTINIVASAAVDASTTPSAVTSFANVKADGTAAGTASAADVAVSGLATAGTTAGYLFVGVRNAANGSSTARDSITATVSGAGQVCTTTGFATPVIGTCGQNIKVSATGDVQFAIQGNGTSGAGTITVSSSVAGWSYTKAASFYSSTAKTITATVGHPLLKVGTNNGSVRATAVDASGTNFTGSLWIVASSAADALIAGSTTPVSCGTYSTTDSRFNCPVDAIAVGTAKFKVIDASTVAAATATSNEVTVTVTAAVPASVKLSFDKTSYAPNERARIYVTPLDAAGKEMQSIAGNLLATGGISVNGAISFTGSTTTADSLTVIALTTSASSSSTTGAKAGSVVYTVYMPSAGGTVTLTATGGDALPVSARTANAITATATVTDSGAAALAAVTALATTVASLKTLITTLTNLVLKIQKKVKA